MAAVWIRRFYNFTQNAVTILNNDGKWRPIIDGKRYAVDEPILLAPERLTPITNSITLPFTNTVITTVVPPGPSVLYADYFMVGWSGYARTLLIGPAGSLELIVGPLSGSSGNDFLRGIDNKRNEVLQVEMGPGGDGFVASLDLDMIIENDNEVRIFIRSSSRVGQDVLERADKALPAVAKIIADALFKK